MHRLAQQIQRLERRWEELTAWRDRAVCPLPPGLFWGDGQGDPVLIRVGERWPYRPERAWIRFQVQIPPGWAGLPVAVRLGPGGEGLLWVNGVAWGGLDTEHREHRLTAVAPSETTWELLVEVVPRGPSGRPVAEPRLEEGALVVPHEGVRILAEELRAVLQAARAFLAHGRADLAAALIAAADATLREISLPRAPTEAYLARLTRSPHWAQRFGELWEGWRWAAEPLALSLEAEERLVAAREMLHQRLNALRATYPPEGRLYLLGHAHLDLAWLWPLAETRRKARRTFATVLRLMEEDPEFRFGQSMAQIYADLEAEDPELFAHIRARVAEGRWELLGGMWVEPEGNLPAGEAWVRQLLYGQQYFETRFGRRARVAWLPDTFGFAGNLPQLFLQAGMPYFFTTKLNWNEVNRFPYDLYWWEGIDGSRVLAHSFQGPYGFNGRLEAEELLAVWRGFRGKAPGRASLYTFGHGDGGGGPTAEMLTAYRTYREFPGLPRLVMESAEAFFEGLGSPELPIWYGEQYLELHRGTYTTQARLKGLNRRLEHLLIEAEAAAALAGILMDHPYPQEALEALWKSLLRNQFHDILAGSSIRTVVWEAEAELERARAQAEALREEHLARLSQEVAVPTGAAMVLVCWNLALEDRPLRGVIPRPLPGPLHLIAPDGHAVLVQELPDGRIAFSSPEVRVPGLGYLALAVHSTPAPRSPEILEVSSRHLENERLRVEIGPDGTLHSIFDKEVGREVLADRGNVLWAYTDLPREWEAWDIEADDLQAGEEVRVAEPPEVVEAGPVRAAVRVVRRLEGAEIEQIYRLWAGSRRLEIDTVIHWRRRRTMLRALFPLAVRSHEAWFETAFGAVARPTHRNTSWEAARFEVPGHRWADLSEAGYGVSLLNDSRYGYSVQGNTLGLTLLRSPVYPDPLADEGVHRVIYALYPHPGDWRNGTVAEAHDLNAPMPVLGLSTGRGQWSLLGRLLSLEVQGGGMLRLAAFKRGERGRGWILRVYEAHGGRGWARWGGALLLRRAEPVNLLEDPIGEPLDGLGFAFSFGPYQVLSWRLELERPPSG